MYMSCIIGGFNSDCLFFLEILVKYFLLSRLHVVDKAMRAKFPHAICVFVVDYTCLTALDDTLCS